MTTTASRAARAGAAAGSRVRSRRVPRIALPRWALHGLWRLAAAGLVVGVLLVSISPLVAGIAGIAVAGAGIVLSEGRMHSPARKTMIASLGLMTPALVYLVIQLVRLL